MIVTEGESQNSYITVSEANAILSTIQSTFFEVGDTLSGKDDIAYLCEAFRDLQRLWSWQGQPTTPTQIGQWPRKYVPKPGWTVPGEPGWSVPEHTQYDWLAYKARFLDGSTAADYLPDDVVPLDIKEAQAMIAMLRKSGSNLVGDNQGDMQGMTVGKIKVSYVNAIRESADIHKRTGQYGRFLGGLLTGV